MLYNLMQSHKAKNELIGLYTSPHLIDYNERIIVNNKMITDNEIIQYSNEIFETCKDIAITFFEFTTLMAFMHFSKNK